MTQSATIDELMTCPTCRGAKTLPRIKGAFTGFGRHDRRRRQACPHCFGSGNVPHTSIVGEDVSTK